MRWKALLLPQSLHPSKNPSPALIHQLIVRLEGFHNEYHWRDIFGTNAIFESQVPIQHIEQGGNHQRSNQASGNAEEFVNAIFESQVPIQHIEQGGNHQRSNQASGNAEEFVKLQRIVTWKHIVALRHSRKGYPIYCKKRGNATMHTIGRGGR